MGSTRPVSWPVPVPAVAHRQPKFKRFGARETRDGHGKSGKPGCWFLISADRCEGEVAIAVLMYRMAVRTAGATCLGAGAERIVDDGLDGARATAALCAATEAAVELLGVARKILRTLDGTADVVVAQHVTGTDDH